MIRLSRCPTWLLSFTWICASLYLLGCRQRPEQDSPATADQEIVTQEVTRVIIETVPVEGTPVEITRLVEQVVEVTAVPTSTERAPETTELVICLVNEPPSLYLYDRPLSGMAALTKKAILHAVYENLLTTLSFEYQAQGLEKLPDLEEGDAEVRNVVVEAGDSVVDANDEVKALASGVTVRTAAGEEVTFDGTPLSMPQMVVRFTFKPMVWSDGVPVTAADSVFSYEISADPATLYNHPLLERTADYTAVDDLTVQWIGLPGWLDPVYFSNIWTPLPAHQLDKYSAAELARVPEATTGPLSNGPFVVSDWVRGESITMARNEHYYRSGEGFPAVDAITFRFVKNSNQLVALLLAGECDIGTQDGLDISQAPLLLEAQASGLLVPVFQASNVFEHIDFGIDPEEEYAAGRPDWFEDVQVRQAMTMCTNRQAMVDQFLLGLGQVAHAYIPPDHPLHQEGAIEYPYDVEAAKSLLDEAGFRDRDGDGVRQDPETEAPFEVNLGVNLSATMRQQVAQMFQRDLAKCGIAVRLDPQPAAEWFAPEGPLFGRRFDLAYFPWITGLTPDCDLYTTVAIPGPGNDWLGNNVSGWSDKAYDAACESALAAPVGTESYEAGHQEALRIFTDQVPVISLFFHLKVAAARPGVTHLAPDPTQESELWNLFEIGKTP